MISAFDVSMTFSVHLKYCRRHQRAWVESLDHRVPFPARAMYGSPVTEAACDTCTGHGIPDPPGLCGPRTPREPTNSMHPQVLVSPCTPPPRGQDTHHLVTSVPHSILLL